MWLLNLLSSYSRPTLGRRPAWRPKLEVLEGRIAPATLVWDGVPDPGGSNLDNLWMTGTNWVGDVAPMPGDSLEFPAGPTVLNTNNNFFSAGAAFASILFSGSGYTLSGNGITLANGISTTNTSGFNQVGFPVGLTAPQTWTALESGSNLAINGSVDLASFNLTFTGDGSIDLGVVGDTDSASSSNGIIVNAGANGTVFLNEDNANDPITATLNSGSLAVFGDQLKTSFFVTGGLLYSQGSIDRTGPITATGGTISPGNMNTDVLDVAGDVAFNSATTVRFDLFGLTPGLEHDRLSVTDNVNLGGSTLLLNLGIFTPTAGDTFTIVNLAGSTGFLTGTFNGLAEGTAFAAGGSFFNITYRGGDGNDVVLTAVDPTDLSVTKTDSPDPVVRGGTITYTITVSNPGPADALDVKLTDAIPAGTTFVSFSKPQGFTSTEPQVGGTGTITSTASSLAPGNAVFTLIVQVDPDNASATVTNTATVTSKNDPSTGNNSATEPTAIIGPDLSVTKTDSPDPVLRGDLLTYTITLTNPGPGNALNVTLNDTIPAGTTFDYLIAPAGFTSTTPPVGGTGNVNSTSPSMAPGNAVFTLVVRINAGTAGTVTNTATVTSLSDTNAVNDSDTEQTAVLGPDLVVLKSGPRGPVKRGDNITYTLTITNPGAGNGLNVVLTDTVPVGTTFVSLTAPAGFISSTPAVGGRGTVTSTAASLAAGSAVLTLVVRVDADTLFPFVDNTVAITSLDEVSTATSLLNNTAVFETEVDIPALGLSAFEDTEEAFTVARFAVANPGGSTGTPLPSFTAAINWGDGTSSSASVVNESNQVFVVRGSHLYTNENPHYPDEPFPLSLTVSDGVRRFDMRGTALVLERPFPGGDRGTSDDRWLAEVEDNFRDPDTQSVNQDDAQRLAFVNQWKTLLAEELARTGNPREARRRVMRQYLSLPGVLEGIVTQILGGVPNRLSREDAVRLIDAFYRRYLEHGDRSPSWSLAVENMLRRNRRRTVANVLQAVRYTLVEFLSSEEYFHKTFR